MKCKILDFKTSKPLELKSTMAKNQNQIGTLSSRVCTTEGGLSELNISKKKF